MPIEFKKETSPLNYHGTYPQRLSLIDLQASPPTSKETYFTSTGRGHRKLPGASPGVVAFVDYDIWPDDSIYVHFVITRSDHRGRGYMAKLLDKLLQLYSHVPYVNLGEIHAKSVLHYYQKKRQESEWGYRLKGKIRGHP